MFLTLFFVTTGFMLYQSKLVKAGYIIINRLSVAILAVATVAMTSAADELEISIAVGEGKSYRSDELMVTIKNISGEKQNVAIDFKDANHFVGYVVKDKNGKYLEYIGPEYGTYYPCSFYQRMEPRASYVHVMSLRRWFEIPAGIYTVRAVYKYPENQECDNVWTGEIWSNTVTITVLE